MPLLGVIYDEHHGQCQLQGRHAKSPGLPHKKTHILDCSHLLLSPMKTSPSALEYPKFMQVYGSLFSSQYFVHRFPLYLKFNQLNLFISIWLPQWFISHPKKERPATNLRPSCDDCSMQPSIKDAPKPRVAAMGLANFESTFLVTGEWFFATPLKTYEFVSWDSMKFPIKMEKQ